MAKPSLRRFTLCLPHALLTSDGLPATLFHHFSGETELRYAAERYHVATESVAFQAAIIMKSAVVETLSHGA